MNLDQQQTITNRLREIPLASVLLAAGANHDRYDKARWHTPKGIISVTGIKFYNWNCSLGGGGAIDLVIHLYGLDFKGALTWLGRHFSEDSSISSLGVGNQSNLKLPIPDLNKLHVVKHYLNINRKINSAIIDYLIQRGDLYADTHSNAVFVMRTCDRVIIGAELRGTGHDQWRGMAKGSRKDSGYFSIRNVFIEGIILCESAIDAVSCFIIHPNYNCLSTAGVRRSPCWLASLIRQYPKVYCGFDADIAGDTMADALIKLHPLAKRLRPQQHDWNDLLRPQKQTINSSSVQ